MRVALALEATILEAHTQRPDFPMARRPVADTQVARMRQAARGDTSGYADAHAADIALAIRSALVPRARHTRT